MSDRLVSVIGVALTLFLVGGPALVAIATLIAGTPESCAITCQNEE